MQALPSLPIGKFPAAGESGMSWVLRVATANLVSMSWLRSRLAVLQPRPFNAEDSLKLAAVLAADPSELRARLPIYGRVGRTPAILYFGQTTLIAPCLRFRRPQVCPTCLHCFGYCPGAWDYSCHAVCPIHHVPMVEQCVRCKHPLTWDRPSIDVCKCGAYIESTPGEPSEVYKMAGLFSSAVQRACRWGGASLRTGRFAACVVGPGHIGCGSCASPWQWALLAERTVRCSFQACIDFLQGHGR